jgi:hypothetical protein
MALTCKEFVRIKIVKPIKIKFGSQRAMANLTCPWKFIKLNAQNA